MWPAGGTAHKCAKSLQRSAEPVAHALLLNQQILQEQIQWITQRETLARQVEYREKVLKPFVEDKKLGETWKNAWIKHTKQVPTIEPAGAGQGSQY